MIGLGDILLPGIFVAFCHRYGKSLKTNSYYYACMFGYAFGLTICVIFLIFFNVAQPALLYLTPSTLIPVIIVARIKN